MVYVKIIIVGDMYKPPPPQTWYTKTRSAFDWAYALFV
jgi:hypothetical protein